MKIGLIGNGFVGSAVYENLKNTYNFLIYDRKPELSNCESIANVIEHCSVVFVALPTPMYQHGKCDLSIVFEAMQQIYANYNDNIIILKSTVPPGTCQEIKKRHPKMRIVFSPEFLTEANHIEDFKNCNRMIFGGHPLDTADCVKVLHNVFNNKYYFTTDWKTAEMVKYFINNFLSIKVSFANEMFQICAKNGANYEDIVNLALYDSRIGKSHLQVPGPDGDYGFGGKCFPKDLNAMISYGSSKGVSCSMLRAAWEKNIEVREKQDWHHIEGAVSKEKSNE